LKSIFTILILILPFLSLSQIVKGTAQSAETKQGLAYASVLIKGTDIGTLTDDNGYFELNYPEEHENDSLTIQYIGYSPVTVTIQSVQEDAIVFLTPRDSEIEAVIVTPVDADSIMLMVRKNFKANHFREKQKQKGFSRANYRNEGNLFQVSESSYERLMTLNGERIRQKIKPIKSRMVIDSSAYKELNQIFNFKKDTLFVEPYNFIGIGHGFGAGQSSTNRRIQNVYEYIDTYEYEGREVYEINEKSYWKGVYFVARNYLIDVEKYGVLSYKTITTNAETINSSIPFVARAALTILGYKVKLNGFNSNIYYRYNGDFFELDKGNYKFEFDIARKGEWVVGQLDQEFYLQSAEANNEEVKQFYYEQTDIVSQFEDDYFDGFFHLPTTEKTLEKIDVIREKNKNFEGNIASDRHTKWGKKQDKKKKRREAKGNK